MATQAASIAEMLSRRGIKVDPAKLAVPDVGTLVGAVPDEFAWQGEDYMPKEAEYARAAGMTPDLLDLSVQAYTQQGYVAAPGIKARMTGCHTEGEVIMIRSRDVGDAHREAEEIQRVARESGGRRREAIGQDKFSGRTTETKHKNLVIQPPKQGLGA